MTTLIRGLVVAVVAALGGAVTWFAVGGPSAEPPPAERLESAAAALAESPLYVANELDGWLSPDEVESIETTIRTAGVPLRVLVVEGSREAGYRNVYTTYTWLDEQLGTAAIYLIVSPDGFDVEEPALRAWMPRDYERVGTVEDGTQSAAQAAERVVTYAQALQSARVDPIERSDFPYWGGIGGMIAALVMIGVLGGATLAGVLAVIWFRKRAQRMSDG